MKTLKYKNSEGKYEELYNVYSIKSEEEVRPNNEIWYKTSDNQPISLQTIEGFGANFISNTYDENDGYCKIKFDGDVITIPGTSYNNGFMYLGTTLTDIIHLPSTITSIRNNFLSSCSNLIKIDLSGLKNVKSIEHGFLYGCKNLQSLDLSSLNNVTSIGDTFLYACTGLTSLDLSGLSGVTSIGELFLYSCINLKTFIIDVPDKVVSLPLEKSQTTPDSIYVNDELIEQYKEAVPKFADKFKPLSTYKQEE